MKTIKRVTCIVTALLMLVCLAACGSKDESAAKDVLKSYFDAYEKANYEEMKQYCTDTFVSFCFHDSDVLGASSAKLVKIEESADSESGNSYAFDIVISEKPVEGSARYDANQATVETSVTYMLQKQSDGKWLIADMRVNS